MKTTSISTDMNATKEPVASRIVPKPILKGKDGREAFADKIAADKAFIERVGIPEELKGQKPLVEQKG